MREMREMQFVRSWRTSHRGNRFRKYGGYLVIVFQKAGWWRARIERRADGHAWFVLGSFAEIEKAKRAAFNELIEDERDCA